METVPQRREVYTHGYSEERRRIHGRRVAEVEAAFLLPHLRPGMRLLDFGCGPGSITIGLAQTVAPGEVIGVDIAPQQIAVAHALAADLHARNLRFAVSSVYDLPFPDASFDAAFGRSVLEHLADPLAALREVRRVLKPGGVIGVRDGDWGGLVLAPPNALAEEGLALYARLWALNGGNPKRGHEHRALLRAAGFSRIVASAGADAMGTPEAVQRRAELLAEQLTRPAYSDQILANGWADGARLERIAAEVRAWCEHPDAFLAVLVCEAIGWAD